MDVLIRKMIFIYNALQTGWTVRMIEKDQFEFKQRRSRIKYNVELESYVKKFVKDNMRTPNELRVI